MINIKKVFFAAVCLFVTPVVLAGCSAPGETYEDMPDIPQGRTDKINITITCNSGLEHFAAAVEEQFPDVRLIQDCYTGQYRNSEHIARIEHGDFGDIIMVKAGHIPKIDMSGQLADLSAQVFPASFSVNILQADDEGHINLIPGPLSFNCNIYNKTLFEENGWEVPESYNELLALCQEIDKTGIRGFRNSYFDSASQSYQIYQYSVFSALDTLTQVDGQIWHNKLMAGEKVSLEPMKTAFENLQQMIDIGAVREEDMDVPFLDNMEAMADREVAIGGGEVNHIETLNAKGKDKFCFMPHFSMTDGQGWLLNLGYFFGVNKEVEQPGNEARQKAVMDIMGFIASEEGQKYLVEDGLGMMSATIGAKVPDNPVLEQISTQIESGRYIMRPTYGMFSSVLETEIGAFIRGETDSEAVLEKCSKILEKGVPPKEIIGEVEEDFSFMQTACLKADALRAAAGTDVALAGVSEINGYNPVGAIRTKLYKGSVTEDDITRITQSKMDTPFMSMRASVTGDELLALLEYGAASEDEQQSGQVSRFHPFAVSGLKLSYHMDKDEGKRVSSVKMEDGSSLQPDALYTISYIRGTFPEGKLNDTETGITMTDAFRNYITKEKQVAPDKKRIRF